MNMLESVPKGSTIAMDRGYTNYAFFHKATQNGVTYVTKAKKNMVYKTLMLYRETANSPQKQEYEVRTIVFGEKERARGSPVNTSSVNYLPRERSKRPHKAFNQRF